MFFVYVSDPEDQMMGIKSSKELYRPSVKRIFEGRDSLVWI